MLAAGGPANQVVEQVGVVGQVVAREAAVEVGREDTRRVRFRTRPGYRSSARASRRFRREDRKRRNEGQRDDGARVDAQRVERASESQDIGIVEAAQHGMRLPMAAVRRRFGPQMRAQLRRQAQIAVGRLGRPCRSGAGARMPPASARRTGRPARNRGAGRPTRRRGWSRRWRPAPPPPLTNRRTAAHWASDMRRGSAAPARPARRVARRCRRRGRGRRECARGPAPA